MRAIHVRRHDLDDSGERAVTRVEVEARGKSRAPVQTVQTRNKDEIT